VAALGEAARDQAFSLVQELRRRDLAGEMDFEGRSLKAQMTLADRLNAAYVVILGERELATGLAQVRPMQHFASQAKGAADLTEVQGGRLQVQQDQVRFEELVDYLAGKIGANETR
jgi:histidyl-tRNA synthetase